MPRPRRRMAPGPRVRLTPFMVRCARSTQMQSQGSGHYAVHGIPRSAGARLDRQWFPFVIVDEGSITTHPLRQGIGDRGQGHVLRLEVLIGGTIPVLEYEVPFVIDCLRIHVWRATANDEEAARLSER